MDGTIDKARCEQPQPDDDVLVIAIVKDTGRDTAEEDAG